MSRILVVDDDRDVRETLMECVESFGYEAESAGDGVEALAVFQDGQFDLGIFDIDMPSMNGLELTREIRSVDASFPVVLITGFAHLYLASEVLALDVDAFLKKPLNLMELLKIINNISSA